LYNKNLITIFFLKMVIYLKKNNNYK
jgi:hypothetical protein